MRSNLCPKRRASSELTDSSSLSFGLLSLRITSRRIEAASIDEAYGVNNADNGEEGRRVSPGRPGICKNRSFAAFDDFEVVIKDEFRSRKFVYTFQVISLVNGHRRMDSPIPVSTCY